MTVRSRAGEISRREASKGLLALGGALLLGCSETKSDRDGVGPDDDQDEAPDASHQADESASPPTGQLADAGGDNATRDDAAQGRDGSAGTADAGGMPGWASGGTAVISGNYGDPFTSAASACALLVAATEGPCTEAADRVRQDISEGLPGLPVRLSLKVVDSSCRAIAGAKVKVWHTQISGSYSGNTPNNAMCLKSASDASKHYFRGVQASGADGRVDFDTCFPGWYRGRAIHIHFTVSLGNKSFTSQLLFEQSLVDDVFANHPDYKPYGQPDTTNSADSVVRGNDVPKFLLTTARMSDGVMLASKQLVVNL